MDLKDDGRRAGFRLKARLKVKFKNADSFINEYTNNISKGGLFIRTSKPCQLRDKVEIILVMPDTLEEISALGEVIHVVLTGEASEHTPAGMGIQILEITKESQGRIEKFIADTLKADSDVVSRRKHIRVETRIRVRFESKEALVEEYIHNISHGGIFIQTNKPKPVGEMISIILIHPDTAQEILLRGEVVRMVSEEEAGNTKLQPGMGIRFSELEPYVKSQIDEFIKAEVSKNAGNNLIITEE